MSDLDRYLTDEVVEAALDATLAHSTLAFPCEGGERTCAECGYAFGWVAGSDAVEAQRYAEHRVRATLSAALPNIIQRAKAEALEAARGPYRCCPHCADDLIHDVEKDDHTAPCQLCQSDVIRRAKAEALREMGDWFKLASDLGTGDRDLIAAQACYDRADRIKQGGQP